jgi:DNA gyrase/topoisomerase IV subunit A
VLGYSGKQPTFLKFANDCYSPSPEQAKLIKETKDRKLADAEQARRAAEQQRLAQAQAAEQQRIAAEQQRIAAEQATEQARVRSEQRRQMFMTWRENFAKSLGLQSIPECDKSILNKNMASRHSVVFTTTKETKLYDANPSIMKSTKSRRLLANLQFWGNIPSTTRPTEGPYVWVEGTVNGDKGTEWWGTLPIDSIEVCSLVGQIP